MDQSNESRATDPAIASSLESALNTLDSSENHISTQLQSELATNHQSALNMLGYALTLDNIDTWLGAGQIFRARLSPHELAALSFVVLRAQDPDDATMTAEAVFGLFEIPFPPLISAMDEAAHWAHWAEPGYVKACVLAGFNRMSGKDQSAFLDYVDVRSAA